MAHQNCVRELEAVKQGGVAPRPPNFQAEPGTVGPRSLNQPGVYVRGRSLELWAPLGAGNLQFRGGVNLFLPKIMKMDQNTIFLRKNTISYKKWGPETFMN